MTKKKRNRINRNPNVAKSTVKIFQEKEHQYFYNRLLKLFIPKEEAKEIVFNCIEDDLPCDLTKYEDSLEYRLIPLKENDITLRAKYDINYKYAFIMDYRAVGKIEEIKFINKKETKFNELGYEVFLGNHYNTTWINEKYLYTTIEEANEFLNKREYLLYGTDWIDEIIGDCESVNQLFKIEDIFKEVFNRSNGILDSDNDFDEILDIIECNWEGKTVTIKDGTEVYLDRHKECILHSHHDLYNDFTYKIADDWYICGNCLELLKLDPNKITNDHLFPKNWTNRGIYAWLDKNCWELTHPEEVHKMISEAMREYTYNGYTDYNDNYMGFMYDDDEDDFIYGDITWTEEDEAEYQTKLKREKTSSTPKCKVMIEILKEIGYQKKEAREKAIDFVLEDKFYNKEELINIKKQEIIAHKEFTMGLTKELGKELKYAVGKKNILEIDYFIGKNRKLLTFKVKDSNLTISMKPSKMFSTLEEAQKCLKLKVA